MRRHQMSNAMKVLTIVGTVRQGRNGRKVADWYLSEAMKAAPDLDFELLDVAELALPLFNEATPPLYHQYSSTQTRIAEKIAAADAFVIITGEYNHSIPGSLKNFLDFVASEWNHKVAAFVGYGGTGAMRSIEHIIQVFNYLGVATIKDHITINSVWEALDEKGVPKNGFLFGSIPEQLKELTWWAHALKQAREKH